VSATACKLPLLRAASSRRFFAEAELIHRLGECAVVQMHAADPVMDIGDQPIVACFAGQFQRGAEVVVGGTEPPAVERRPPSQIVQVGKGDSQRDPNGFRCRRTQ
jgi:hypothetical protein